MTEDNSILRGRVAQLVTDDELALNIGSADGVMNTMVFEVLDQATENIRDPVSHKNLGTIDRVKAKVRIIDVSDHVSLARAIRSRHSGISSTAQVMIGQPEQFSTRLSSDTWPEGVRVNDPVRLVD